MATTSQAERISNLNLETNKMDHPCWSLAGLTLFGGAMGYFRKGSVPSLVAGTGVSALYLTAGYLLKNNMEYGIHTALGTSTLLFIAGINRLLAVKGGIRKPVPIMLTVIGGFSTYYYAAKYSEFYR